MQRRSFIAGLLGLVGIAAKGRAEETPAEKPPTPAPVETERGVVILRDPAQITTVDLTGGRVVWIDRGLPFLLKSAVYPQRPARVGNRPRI